MDSNKPHTSAGRIPTDKGYRYYVDLIMTFQCLDDQEKKRIEENVGQISIDEPRGGVIYCYVEPSRDIDAVERETSLYVKFIFSGSSFTSCQ